MHHAFLTIALCADIHLVPQAREVDFIREIRPIFARACFSCHGEAKQRNGLRLDQTSAIREGGVSGPALVPGKARESRLMQAISGVGEVPIMPPKEPRLSTVEISLIRDWIDQGAKLPATEALGSPSPHKELHWSFRPIRRPDQPVTVQNHWLRSPIDVFVLARLEKERIAPSKEADPATLLRRLSLDLIGLPPSPDEVEQFLADSSPYAYQKQIDRLLASPHYGERWGRHWLDLARYADSNGYSIDSPRSIWPFRDWVITALNRDMPFDQFTIEQLAGDLLPNATMDQKIATGFHRNTQINEEGGIDKEQFRIESIVDRVNTTGSVWLGLTVGCCQCHDHKFDPLKQREYYQLFSFFNNQDEPSITLGAKGSQSATPAPRKKTDGRSAMTTMVLQERSSPRETYVMLGGDFTRKGARVNPGTPSLLPALTKPPTAGQPNRLDLARWLIGPKNPLTSRVAVNRAWSLHFGLGLVETENDFGTQGTPPSHPELLDWLASELMMLDSGLEHANRWSLKRLHRLIVSSATYRQSSSARADLAVKDPRNQLLGRQNRQRLEAEVVRDVALSVSGLLYSKIGGPSVFPPQPPGVDDFTQVRRKWVPSERPERYRRGLYTHFWRAAPHPALTAFDAPDAGTACTRRNRSNTPLQALTLLNDAGFSEYSAGLAARLLRDADSNATEIIRRAFWLCLGRLPSADESRVLTTFLARRVEDLTAQPEDAERILKGCGQAAGELDSISGFTPAQKASMVLLSRVVLNLDELVTRE